jgi:hypothetical protein
MRIILKLILIKYSVAGSCENGNEPSDPIKSWKHPDYLGDKKFLKMDTDPWNFNEAFSNKYNRVAK